MPNDNTPKLDNEGQFSRCLGSTLSSWNLVEDSLGDVFCALFGGVNNRVARGAYLAVVNFNARLQMIDAAAQSSGLPEDVFATWRNLRNQANKKADIRNKLTHFTRFNSTTSKGERAIFLMPNFWTGDEWIKAREGKGSRYAWPEIFKFGQDFGQLAIKLFQLSREIEKHRQAHPLEFPSAVRDPNHDSDIPSDS